MNKFKLFLLISCLSSFSAFAQYDDIYFNPKTDIPKKDVRKVVNYSDTEAEQPSVLLDGNVSLTEEDYTYTQRLNAFHNENLLIHIEGNDTTIYDLANGDYNVSVGDNGVDVSGSDTYAYTNPYYGSSDYLVWGWNSWLGMPFYYTNYYSYFGWTPWNDFFYNPWYNPYQDCYTCYHPHNHHGETTYSEMSNETYRRQHNSAGRYDGTRNTVSTTSSSTVGSRNSGTSTNQSVGSTDTRKSQTTGSRPLSTSVSTRGSSNSGSTVRVTTSSSDNGSRYSGTSSSSSSSSGSRTGTSSGSHTTSSSSSGTRSTGTSSGSSSGGSRGGGSSSSSGGGSRGGGGSTTRR